MHKDQLHFIFPSHPLKPRLVKDTFADQMKTFKEAGFSVSTFPDAVIDEGKQIRDIPEGRTVVYRGWMLNPEGYKRLHQAVTSASANLLTSTQDYLAAHHLPNWYEQLKDMTPETVVLPNGTDFESEIAKLKWSAYFIKDYVKSITTSAGSIITEISAIRKALQDFIDYRGELEGGLCIRQVEPFLTHTERRFFVLEDKAYVPQGESIPELVAEVTRRIKLPFYSVDVIEREDGELRLVEIGDGQVSDLKAWSAQSFLGMWQSATA